MLMRLLLVRHGVTLNNQQARYTGQSDVAISPQGKQQAILLAERLAKEPLDVIVSSDLQRARTTAQIIAKHHEIPVYEDAALREMALGAWEGSTFAEVLARDEAMVSRWRADPINYSPPGGETVAQLRERIVDALLKWQSLYPEATMLWVTHAGLIGTLICHLLDIDLKNRRKFRCDTASITEFDVGRDYAILMRMNDTAHLHDLRRDDTSE
jgi:alpha-ribazole phosphatase